MKQTIMKGNDWVELIDICKLVFDNQKKINEQKRMCKIKKNVCKNGYPN